jgi:hypothetical protein
VNERDVVEEARSVALFWQLAISLVVAVVSAVLTVKLAFRRFLAERWWERKADAYSSILQAIHVVKRGIEDDLDSIRSHNQRTDEEYEKQKLQQFRAARDEVYKAIDTASFMLSAEAVQVLNELERDLNNNVSANTVDGFFDGLSALADEFDFYRLCLAKLPDIARRDLGIPAKSLPSRRTDTTPSPQSK